MNTHCIDESRDAATSTSDLTVLFAFSLIPVEKDALDGGEKQAHRVEREDRDAGFVDFVDLAPYFATTVRDDIVQIRPCEHFSSTPPRKGSNHMATQGNHEMMAPRTEGLFKVRRISVDSSAALALGRCREVSSTEELHTDIAE
jgi:hypothetical protein